LTNEDCGAALLVQSPLVMVGRWPTILLSQQCRFGLRVMCQSPRRDSSEK